jgi:protein-disulfide isomerase
MDKRFLVTVGIIIAIFVGFLAFNKNDEGQKSSNTNTPPTQHTRGATNSKVTLIEYGDFQCPACGQYYPALEQVYEKYKDTVEFQFRHFPLTAIHPNAFAGSRAAEAAAKQGKFYEMYNQLYANQTEWSESNSPTKYFNSYAEKIGLDAAKFKTDFASTPVNDAVQADVQAGEKAGVNSTPTFVLNGKVIKNPNPTVEAFSKILDEALKK